jgi:hypothetical protein
MTRTNRYSKLFSPTAGLAVLWAVIRFFLVSYAAVFGNKAGPAANQPGVSHASPDRRA